MMQRLERHDVACELVQAEAIGRAVPAADVVIVEAHAVSIDRVVAPIGSAAVAAVAAACGVPVWLVAGVGRRLPRELVAAIDERVAKVDDPWELDTDVFSTGCITHVVGVHGITDREPRGVRRGVPDGARAVAREPDLSPPAVPVSSSRNIVLVMPSRRDQIVMSEDEIQAYLTEQRILNVATNGPTGHPHLVAMWFTLLDGKPGVLDVRPQPEDREHPTRRQDLRSRRERRQLQRAPAASR